MSVVSRLTIERIETILEEAGSGTSVDEAADVIHNLRRACEQLLSLVQYSARAWVWGDAPADLKSLFVEKTECQPVMASVLVFVPTGIDDPFIGQLKKTDAIETPDGKIYVSAP
jgi:hypothetical protein